jgi:hypothetical protein
MSDYAITGKKGSGKTLFAVGVVRDALLAGKTVATNLDIYLDNLLPPTHRATFLRLPDKPTAADFELIGRGQAGCVEEDNGVLLLDETSTFFNSRAFGDKERQPLLDWLVHSRKLGWDVYYICQGLEQIDKQLRTTMIEYHVGVKKTDKWPIPIITPLASLIGLNVRFPRMHIGIIKHGVDKDSLTVDRKFYRAKEFYSAYDTQQLFMERNHPKACGLHTVLSAYHIKGRYLSNPPAKWLRYIYAFTGHDWTKQAAKPQRKPKHELATLLAKLPHDQALLHWRRLDRLGAFN